MKLVDLSQGVLACMKAYASTSPAHVSRMLSPERHAVLAHSPLLSCEGTENPKQMLRRRGSRLSEGEITQM